MEFDLGALKMEVVRSMIPHFVRGLVSMGVFFFFFLVSYCWKQRHASQKVMLELMLTPRKSHLDAH